MSDFKSRLLEEKTELQEKHEKLKDFLNSKASHEIDSFQFTMLHIQESAMQTYLHCLTARINKL